MWAHAKIVGGPLCLKDMVPIVVAADHVGPADELDHDVAVDDVFGDGAGADDPITNEDAKSDQVIFKHGLLKSAAASSSGTSPGTMPLVGVDPDVVDDDVDVSILRVQRGKGVSSCLGVVVVVVDGNEVWSFCVEGSVSGMFGASFGGGIVTVGPNFGCVSGGVVLSIAK